ncbi:MAG TPA: SDR family oxidoreductase [Sporichthyaceae bacterium]|jgi:NAD(P)H dehydrogenase (quinone)|nr:SDR family oxidoreductase [Sporichthyaceae bacterium]
MIVVTGATGRLGRQVVTGLLDTLPADQIVAAVRDPAKAKDFADRGVQIRVADYDEPRTLTSALDGADRLLLISSNNYEHAVAQHTAAIDAAKQAGVGRLVYTSLAHADTTTLATAIPHRLTEPIVRASGLPFTLLRNNLYTDHYAAQVAQAVTAGVFVGSAGTGRVASATIADYAAAAVAVLTGDGHDDQVYELGGDVAWGFADLVAELSRITGRQIEYRNLPADQHVALLVSGGVQPFLAELFVNVYQAIGAGQLSDTSGDLHRLIGRPPTSLTDWLASVTRD